MNVVFAKLGYRVFTVEVDYDSQPIALLTKRSVLAAGKVQALRLSNTVYIEARDHEF